MRALFAGEEVSHDGLVTVDRARLYSLPAEPPALIGAAVSTATAEITGSWADGLITVNQQPDALRDVLAAFDAGGGSGRPRYLQVHVSWADTDDEALAIAHDQWRTNVFAPPVCWDLELTTHFDEVAKHVRPGDMHDHVLISCDPSRLCDRLVELAELGFDGVWIHHVGKQQERFIDVFGEHVVPSLRAAGQASGAATSRVVS
jgi:alkanesulfonate monooxygenase SsuD/methylene tetrahydromethanopterin reductase-like flavin-dependent oxidoreductase (luciferase family)